ncbi:MAG: DUF3179 domain-containing protein [Candidatus Campbellbacteria bacterium]|nr:DUF3179 domain-containing protein [Candidatus Campbellbacteria bacterium]
MKIQFFVILIIVVAVVLGISWYLDRNVFSVPSGETQILENNDEEADGSNNSTTSQNMTEREILVTDDVKHSIPLDEIISGGPGKDGIPSIDDPQFLSAEEADFLKETDTGIGLVVGGEARFYPYRILVWHEIVNDTINEKSVLVTYCPLCATGVVFERRVGGEIQEFGVSGRLWQSNLLMYNRASNEDEESLWSQVLGEAVLGPNTGEKLAIIRSNVVRWESWQEEYPDTLVLSRETGSDRDYARDPYGGYYTSDSVSYGATFNDSRLHPKELVHGIEIDGQYKAYHGSALSETTTDTFAGKEITISKTDVGEIEFTAEEEVIPHVTGFWFSWLAVHPDTELYK